MRRGVSQTAVSNSIAESLHEAEGVLSGASGIGVTSNGVIARTAGHAGAGRFTGKGWRTRT
jgi:hypothetical protein